ncbi:MAG: restriction endonuclease subunit S [Alistipes sp.]|uniref:restriction endonuclease subunit S n=1 Tax=Alistipes sp. TaxID=1872444 RepID=UPI003993A318
MRFPEFTGEWKETTLGKIGGTFNGLTGKSGSDFGQGCPYITYKSIFDNSRVDINRVDYVTISDEERRKESQNKVLYGDIFFTTSSETPDEVGMTSVLLDKIEDCYLNSFCFGYRLFCQENYLPEYLRFYFRSRVIRRKLSILAQGSTRFNISKKEVMRLGVKVPNSTEQRKIANFLTLLDERIATQNKIIEDLKKLKSAIAERVFRVAHCDTVSLSEACTIQKGKQVNGEYLSETGRYYVMNGGIEPSGYYDKCNTPADTISISEGGNSCGYIQYNREAFWSSGHCYTLNNINPDVCKLYLYHYLKSQESAIMKLRIGTGLPNIQKKDLEKFNILLPTVAKQERISTFLTAIESKIMNEEMFLSHFHEEKQYLLRHMFI